MRLKHCYNFEDYRSLARQRLPAPIFHYIDGGADDEVTRRKNAESFNGVDLVPDVLRGVGDVDMSVQVMGQKLATPFYCSPTALQRLFHPDGEYAVGAAANAMGTMFGVSSLGTVSIEELRRRYKTPQAYQFYFHKDRGVNRAMMERAKAAGVDVMMLTVDTITGGNRERDLRTGFSIPLRLTLGGMMSFALKPRWILDYLRHEKFRFPQLEDHIDMSGGAISVGKYLTETLDPAMSWDDAAEMVAQWDGQFCLKGVMSVADAKRAVDIGCNGIILSNHGGRQLDGSRTAFDQLGEVVDAVGGNIDIMMDGGIKRGTHVLKALAMGAKAVGIGRYYLFALAAAGQEGVEHALNTLKSEVERDMKLMGCTSLSRLSKANLAF
ncbi:MAG: alpha-hydroxy acid oxidase [Hyphomicrobiales bacterium]|nr:alpha-hydroxy acid oxidase [Hyphomicrobiales bacterium]MCY4049065.1 alpha-hydroxy acid oxidase [Hyphomicrobiales bacterium]